LVVIHTSSDLDKLRECGRIVAMVHRELKKIVVPGITTLELDKIAEDIIRKEKGLPSFKGLLAGKPCTITLLTEVQIEKGKPL
jgi:methionyl aminopeptidase